MSNLLATLNALDQETGGSVQPSRMGSAPPLPEGRNQYRITGQPQVEYVENLGKHVIRVPVGNDDAQSVVDVIVPSPGDTHEWAELTRQSFAAFAHAIGAPLDQQGGVRLSMVGQLLPACVGKWVELDVTHKILKGKVVDGRQLPDMPVHKTVRWAPVAGAPTPAAQQAVAAAATDFGATAVAPTGGGYDDSDIPFGWEPVA